MIELFYNRIINKERTFSEVNVKYQLATHNMLLANGYDDNGDKIPVVIEQ
ncbi:hypothetical protein G9F72_011115 [Clostridium estertheticum]|nr:hypothetical protein [Clostridium estertheticum]MBZ9686875.1 hypothetical protein [Clostridium estertheticum]